MTLALAVVEKNIKTVAVKINKEKAYRDDMLFYYDF